MTTWAHGTLTVLMCGILGACAGATQGHTTGGEDCVSHYEHVASAPGWRGLEAAMLASEKWGAVTSVRTQARGGEDVGAGDQQVVRVVDLLDRRGRRLVQADVWRTDAGAWRAGVWQQCTD
jgi:hypothetical protein